MEQHNTHKKQSIVIQVICMVIIFITIQNIGNVVDWQGFDISFHFDRWGIFESMNLIVLILTAYFFRRYNISILKEKLAFENREEHKQV